MKRIFRIVLFSALTLILLAACGAEEGTPTAGGTTVPDTTGSPSPVGTETAGTETTGTEDTTATVDLTGTAPATDTTQTAETETTATPGGPGTEEVILLECQFCIEGMGNALLVLPEASVFDIVSPSTPGPDTGCNTVDTFGGRQVVLCRGEENISITLDICTNGECTQFEVELQPCPDTGTPGPGVTDTPGAGETGTPTAATGATGTPTPAAGSPTATPTP